MEDDNKTADTRQVIMQGDPVQLPNDPAIKIEAKNQMRNRDVTHES